MKIAIVLFNLGGPTDKESIKPFLFNFFMDKNIIGAPLPIRYLLAKWIAFKRSKKEAGEAYDQLGGKSPLLENTNKQARALQKELKQSNQDHQFKTFVCMRYWKPMTDKTVQDVKKYNPDKIILLPLYPQYSTTTTNSSFEQWEKESKKQGLQVPTSTICCYPKDKGFIQASTELIKTEYKKFPPRKKPRLLFSAHGLPEKIIKAGDPYQYQCEKSAQEIVKKLKIKNLDWQICYQSRVGPLKWIGPSTEEAIDQAAKDKKPILIYPHAFVSEHVETLVEIEEEYREYAKEKGITKFGRVPTVSTNKGFIKGLAEMVLSRINQKPKIASNENKIICPKSAKRCCMREKKR